MSLKKNILYSSILTTANYIFPLLVYPYVSRVLGVTNIGICNFVDSIIHYFILFSMMGITIMGTREIAASKTTKESLDSKFSSLLALNGIFTITALGILAAVTVYVPQLWENRQMMLYGGVKIISNFFLIEWVYKGMEDFRYITMRTIVVKCLYVISVFIFIQDSNDYPTYYLLTCLMVTGNAVINFIHARKYAKFRIRLISLKSVIKPFLILGLYTFITSMCVTFNVAFLGFTTDETQVGYYTTATKLYSIILALFTGITSVIMPRMSSLLAENKTNEFKALLSKTSVFLVSLALPVILLTTIFANQIILLIAGPNYGGAVIPMKIVMPLMLIIGFEQIVIIQGLMPLRKDKVIMRNSSIAAALSLTLNILIVPKLASIGSAIVWISCETLLLIISVISLYKAIKIHLPIHIYLKNVVGYLPLAAILLLINSLEKNESYWVNLIFGGVCMGLYVLVLQLFILKNPILLSFLKISKFRKK